MRSTIERPGSLGFAFQMILVLALITPASARADALVPAIPGEWIRLDAPPAPPGDLRVEASGETAARIRWDPSHDDKAMVAYEVVREGQLLVRTRSLSFADAGLTAATRYCYSVRTVDLSGRTSRSTGSACVTTPDLTPPETPAAPTMALDSPTSVSASWPATTDNVGVAGYEVLRGGRPHLSLPGLRAADTALRPAQAYCYSVRAFDAAGNRSPSSPTVCVTPPDVTPPTPPRAVATPGARTLTIQWPASVDDVGVAGYELLRGEEVLVTTRALEIARTELPAGRHCFSVRAFDAAGNRSAAVEACGVVPDTTPPSTPTAVEASAPGETSVVLRWAPSTDDLGVVGYEVSRDDRIVARAATTGGGDEGLRPSTAYCYTVRACDAAGNRSDPSAPACVTTPDLTPPSQPSMASATPLSDRSLRIVWLASTDNVGVGGYEILRDGAVVSRSMEPAAEVKGLAPGRDYCHEVVTFDAAGNRSPHSTPACAHTPDLTPPSVPAGLLAVAASPSRISVAWSPSEDDVAVAGYEIWRGDVLVARSQATAWLEAGLGPTTEHCFQLRAFDAAGNVSDRSPPVCARTAAAGTLAAPVELEVDPASARAVTLKWKPSPDPGVVYAVFWDGEKRIGSTRFSTYKVDGLNPGQLRCFQVAAVDENGNSSPKTWPVCAATSATPSASAR